LSRGGHSYFFTSTATAAFPNVVLAQGACCIDVQPLIDAGAVKMVPTREFTQLCTVIICRKADTTLCIFSFKHFLNRLICAALCHYSTKRPHWVNILLFRLISPPKFVPWDLTNIIFRCPFLIRYCIENCYDAREATTNSNTNDTSQSNAEYNKEHIKCQKDYAKPVKLRCIPDNLFTSSRYPVKSNYPPYEGEHRISRLQVLGNTGVIGAATTAIKLPVILVAGRGRSIAAPFLVGGRWAHTALAVAHPVLDGDADHMDDALEGVAGDPGPERHGRVLVAAEHEHDRGDGDEGEVPEQVERHDGAGVGPVRLPLLEVLRR
jgi:hypothetical protein